MTDQTQQKTAKLILPPLRLYARSRTSSQALQNYISFVKQKKEELQQELKEQDAPTPNLELSYAHSQLSNNNKKNIEGASQELFARGSTGQHVEEVDREPRRRKLIQNQLFHSRIETVEYPSRLLTSVNNISEQTPINQIKYSRHFQRSQTEPNPHLSFNLQNNSFRLFRPHLQNKQSKPRVSKSSMPYQSSRGLFKSRNKTISKQQIEGQEFKANPLFKDQKEKSGNRHPKLKKSKVKIQVKEVNKPDYSEMVYPEQSEEIMEFLQAIEELKNQTKTNERLERTAGALEKFNPLFKKIQKVIAVCLLRIGKIQHKQPQHILFEPETAYPYFYIILSGTVKLIGAFNMHKMCETGQTLLEQLIFDNPKTGEDPISQEKAKIVEQSWLLRLEINDFIKLQKELVKYGYKRGLLELKNILRRNQIVKNWIRNKYKLLSVQ